MKLIAADLRALANLPASPAGRRIVFGMVIGLGILAAMSWQLAALASRHVGNLVARDGADDAPLLGLLGHGLTICPVVATWTGLAMARQQLFETPELVLWRQAPIAAMRGPLQVFVRAVLVSTLWAATLSSPWLVTVLRQTPAPPLAYALVPIAILACTAPLLASMLGVQIVLVRFLSGRWLRLLLALVAALASVGFTLWLLLTLFRGGRERIAALSQAAADGGADLPPSVAAAARLLTGAATGEPTLPNLLPVVAWLAAAIAVLLVAAPLHSRAHERYVESDRPLWRRRGRWSTSLTANMRRKEFAQVIQQPGALIGFLVFAVLVFVLSQRNVLVADILSRHLLPRELRHTAAMLTWWFLAILLVLYAHMGRLALWDGRQWSLYVSSPAHPGQILRGKLQAIAVFLLWPLVLVTGAGVYFLGADASSLGWFAGFASAGSLCALGVVATIGTWPRLLRPDADGQILQGGRSFLAAMVMVTTFQLTMLPAILAWAWLLQRSARRQLPRAAVLELAPTALALALAYGLLVAALGTWLGQRNYRRLLAAR